MVTMQPDISSISNSAGIAVISFDLELTFVCPKTKRCSLDHALTMCKAFSWDALSYDPLWALPSMATTSTPNFQPTIAPTAENIAQILWGWFSNTLLNVSGLGFRMVVLETSTTTLFIESILFNIFPTLCPAITAKIAIVMISVSKWHLVLSTLGSFTCVKYSWNLLVMSNYLHWV